MIKFVRKIVAGPKSRTVWEDMDLDMTYITQRVIAMAYPASGLEKAYRNSIDDVARYFKERHEGHYLIINISMRKYDYDLFDGKVRDYFWPDHQAPPLSTIFQVCLDMHLFLKQDKEGVISVHCNHGKGRTGTAIIAFMLYTKHFPTAEAALHFYNQKRFIVNTYGVDQPCQRRYLTYTENILKAKQLPKKLRAFRVVRINQQGLENNEEFYVRISTTRNCQTKHTHLPVNQSVKNYNIPLMADIFIELFQKTWRGDKQVARVNYCLEFALYSEKYQAYKVGLKSSEIKVNSKMNQFYLELIFIEFCECHLKESKSMCQCYFEREREEKFWLEMCDIVNKSHSIKKQEANLLVYGSHVSAEEEQMIQMKPNEPIQSLQQS